MAAAAEAAPSSLAVTISIIPIIIIIIIILSMAFTSLYSLFGHHGKRYDYIYVYTVLLRTWIADHYAYVKQSYHKDLFMIWT